MDWCVLVAALLAMEVGPITVSGIILGAETLLRGPGLDQRAIHSEVLVRHKLLRRPVHFGRRTAALPRRSADGRGSSKTPRDSTLHHPCPGPQTSERAGCSRSARPADARSGMDKEYLQQQRSQNVLRRNRRPPRVRVQRVQLRAQPAAVRCRVTLRTSRNG